MKHKKLGLVVLLGVLILAACSDTGTSANPNDAGPTSVPSLNDACGVVDSYLKAWQKNDFSSMYNLLSDKSRLTKLDDFTKAYIDTEGKMTLKPGGMSYTINCNASILQGTTAAVNYDMTFSSVVVGDFSDPGRTMRLVLNSRGWRIAWSTMDIFEQMAGGGSLQLQYTTSPRGTIFDRAGLVLAQDGQSQITVTFLPGSYPNNAKPDDCYAEIATLFRSKLIDIRAEGNKYSAAQFGQYGYPVGHFDQATYDAQHGALDAVCHVKYDTTTTRRYYANGLAAQFVGYVGGIPTDHQSDYAGYPPDALVGRDGLEQAYQRDLAGTPGAALTIVAPDGLPLRTLATTKTGAAKDLHLTLDRNLQAATEQSISDAYNFAAGNWSPYSDGAAAVVLDAHTGEVLAIASYPSFDVDIFNPHTLFRLPGTTLEQWTNPKYAQSPLANRATYQTSALGSVMKIASMIAAADSKTFGLQQIYTCTGQWNGTKLGDRIRNDWIYLDPYHQDNPQHGPITLIQALTSSCDAYFWQVGATLYQKDPAILSAYATQLGLGKPTGIDIPESTGKIPSPASVLKEAGRKWEIGDSLNTVIGQGDVQVTPIQVAHMIVAIANGGTLYKPYLVKQVGDGPIAAPQSQGKLKNDQGVDIDPKALQGVQQGLCAAVTDKNIGTAEWVYWNWDSSKVVVCGKTGTAQTGTNYPNGWFAAFAGRPGKTPDIAVVVLVTHGREGSETAAPIVRRIIEAYYGIPYNDWPKEWTTPYVNMPDPSMSDGGQHKR